MSLVKVEKSLDVFENNEESVEETIQCCEKHFLVNSRILANHGGSINHINMQDINTTVELEQLRTILKEKNSLVMSLERENLFLREQVKALNILLDQLSVSTKNLATKNDIRIRVENTTNQSFKKWYKRPNIILSGSALAVLFSLYLRYKIKNW